MSIALLGAWCVGLFARGYWTPDEPREADIAWRMSWQTDKAVPLLAGEAFCEKPPFAYWVAGASIRAFGPRAWAARLPNLLYALVAALGVGLLATAERRTRGRGRRRGRSRNLSPVVPGARVAGDRRTAPRRGVRGALRRVRRILCGA